MADKADNAAAAAAVAPKQIKGVQPKPRGNPLVQRPTAKHAIILQDVPPNMLEAVKQPFSTVKAVKAVKIVIPSPAVPKMLPSMTVQKIKKPIPSLEEGSHRDITSEDSPPPN